MSVANFVSAKFSGVWSESAKFMSENFTPPEMVSGTLPMVVTELSQVTTSWMAVTVSSTSAGKVVSPTMKQALACLEVREVSAPDLIVGIVNGVNGTADTILLKSKLIMRIDAMVFESFGI